MAKIEAQSKTLTEILSNKKYSIDYYQREYKWEDKQIKELLDDLTDAFLEEYQDGDELKQVQSYDHYFLGSIIVSTRDTEQFIVDGQQRLTTLTLLLVALHHWQANRMPKVPIDPLIYSDIFGTLTFNIEVPERTPVMRALFDGSGFDPTDQPESVRNIVSRYDTITQTFPEELRDHRLPYFMWWLVQCVDIIQITTASDDDAYTVFETMNDRGLSLSPTDMLKGYLLANISDDTQRGLASQVWRDRTTALTEYGKEVESDFFKTWFRSQYARRIRERKKGARPEEFDRMGTEFHRWLRESSKEIGLGSSDSFYQFIEKNLRFYSRYYELIVRASAEYVERLEHVLYPARQGYTLQYLLMLAPLTPEDDDHTARAKIETVATFVDITLNRRNWNWRSISYSTNVYNAFITLRAIRGKSLPEVREILATVLGETKEDFDNSPNFNMHQQNGWQVHHIIARLTDYVERESGMAGNYRPYVETQGKNRFEIEHIWANHYDRHTGEFQDGVSFASFRNRIGGLLLLPKDINSSLGDLTYEKKLPVYAGQNVLARSLCESAYKNNPGFLAFRDRTGLPFRPMAKFSKQEFEERQELYLRLANLVWSPSQVQHIDGNES